MKKNERHLADFRDKLDKAPRQLSKLQEDEQRKRFLFDEVAGQVLQADALRVIEEEAELAREQVPNPLEPNSEGDGGNIVEVESIDVSVDEELDAQEILGA